MTRAETGGAVALALLSLALLALAGERLFQHPVVWDASLLGRLMAAGTCLLGVILILARRRS